MDASLVEKLSAIKKKITGLNKEVKDLTADKAVLEHDIITAMENEGNESIRTKFGTVTITSEQVANVLDWPDFERYIYETRSLHLMQRRVSNAAYRELLKIHESVPGTEPFMVRKLGLLNSQQKGN